MEFKEVQLGGRHFLIFQSKDMLNICLDLKASQPIYVYKCFAYKK